MARKSPAPAAEGEDKPARKTKAPAAKKVAAKKTKADKPAKEPADRAAAVSATWANPDVAAARNLKSKVKVGGETYRSVLAAFQALELPINKHITFRKELKAAGKLVFKTEDGTKHNFSIVAAE